MSGRRPSAAASRRKAAGPPVRRSCALLPALLMVALGGAATGLLLFLTRQAGTMGRPPDHVAPAERPAAVSRGAEKPPGRTSATPARPARPRLPVSAGPSRPSPSGPVPRSAPGRPSSVRAVRSLPDEGRVALTFDAGAAAEPGWSILQTLRQHDVRCTFFLTGRFAQRNPELVKAIAAAGHEIGNHTFSHPDLRGLSDDAIREELRRGEEAIAAVSGVSTKPWFRPPFGSRDRRVLEVAAGEGYRCVYWTVDSWDSFKKGITAEEIRERVLGRVGPGDVVLFHIGSRATADALPEILDVLKRRGLVCVPVSQLGASIPH